MPCCDEAGAGNAHWSLGGFRSAHRHIDDSRSINMQNLFMGKFKTNRNTHQQHRAEKVWGARKKGVGFSDKKSIQISRLIWLFFFSAHRIELLTLVRIRPIIRCKPFKGTLS